MGVIVAGVLYGGTLAMFHTQMYLLRRTRPAERPTLAMALDALGHDSYLEARRLAEGIDRATLDPADQGGPDYVLGVVAAHEAGELWGPERKNYFLLAARYLALARDRGFNQATGPTGTVLLGESLYFAGRVKASRPVLEQAIELAPDDATMIHRLLSDAYRRKPKPNLEQALAHNRKYLEDANLPLDRSARGPTAAGEPVVANERLCSLPEGRRRDSGRRLRARRSRSVARPAGDARSTKTLNVSLVPRRPRPSASKFSSNIRKRSRFCARRRTIHWEKWRSANRCISSACACWRWETRRPRWLSSSERAACTWTRPRDWPPAWKKPTCCGLCTATRMHWPNIGRCWVEFAKSRLLPIAGLRPRSFVPAFSKAYQYYLEGQHYDQAVQLAERMAPLFPQSQSVQLVAETYRTWARTEVRLSETLPEPQSSETRRRGRELYRIAGRKFEQLAMIEFTDRDYPDDVWQGAECYLAGHQFTAAVSMLEEYLKYELRRRRPTALVHLGEALLALGQLDAALEVLGECIEFYPTDAAGYEARLWAARAMSEKGDPQGAEKLLLENLNGESLTPESKEWRDSLFALGKLLAEDGRHLDAIERLEEAVARYPDSRQAIEARYLIAEACLQAAKVPQEKAASDTGETARLIHRKQAAQLLERAIHYYQETEQVLNRRQEQTELTPLEKSMLRNSYFSVGSALVDLGRWEDAIRAFSAAANRYQHDPEVLDAFTQISYCYRRLNKPREAQGTVRQAMLVLQRIKEDAPFEETTVYSRRQWQELLDWMSRL